tara:strand:+ start:3501 stop:4907 length:1407 start_codon:yes stop_codon:yes gene_type:complete
MTTKDYKIYINGKWSFGENSGKMIDRMNPNTGELVSRYVEASEIDVENAVDVGLRTLSLGIWSELSREKKSLILFKAADEIENNSNELAEIEAIETGKLIEDAKDDIKNSIKLWRFAAASVRTIYGEHINSLSRKNSAYTLYCPIGVVALILPWNFPFIVLSERLPFILAAGCSVVNKPSEYASGTSLMLCDILKKSGLPDGVYNVLTGYGNKIGKTLAEHKDISMISFTGSTENGRSVMASASKNLAKVSLELGGKSPIIVFSDADLEKAANAVIAGFTDNAGQCCIATSRLIVQKSIASDFKDMLALKLQNLNFKQSLATNDQFNKVKSYIEKANNLLGEKMIGGKINEGKQYIAPTIIELNDTNHSLFKNEIFGPILVMIRFTNEKNALEIANDTNYGLAASIWTNNSALANRIVTKINAGRLWINSKQVNFPELPIGGMKLSGIGREAGLQGILSYSEIKSVIF